MFNDFRPRRGAPWSDLGPGASTQGTLILLHIPKTAGTTLSTVVERQFAAGTVHSFGSNAEASIAAFDAWPSSDKVKIRLLAGHMSFGVHRSLPVPSTYVTMLRDPVERMISEYYYILRTPSHYLYEPFAEAGLSLRQALEGRLHVMLNDPQTRLLSGVWGRRPFGELTSHDLSVAKRTLREFCSVVGIAERFDESLLLLKHTFGWRDLAYRSQNVTPGRPRRIDLDASTLRAIERANPLDRELYDYAVNVFEQQQRACGRAYAFDLYRLRVRQRLSRSLPRRRADS